MSRVGVGGGSGGGASSSVLVLNKLIPVAFDNIDITSRNAAGSITGVDYKVGVGVVASLALTYDGNGRLDTVTRT